MQSLPNYLVIVLLLSGDIELNPGPTANSLNIMHHNINSLAPKISEITPELEDFDIAVFTETKLDCTTVYMTKN